jgi:hypothetical protein
MDLCWEPKVHSRFRVDVPEVAIPYDSEGVLPLALIALSKNLLQFTLPGRQTSHIHERKV